MPKVFEWTPNYSVSVSRFDAEHRKLLSVAHSLHNAILERVDRQTIARLLHDFTSCTRAHLMAEEDILLECEYPESDQHRCKHNRFRRQMDRFEKRFLNGNAQMTVHLMYFVNARIANHILNTDKRYSDFFNILGMY